MPYNRGTYRIKSRINGIPCFRFGGLTKITLLIKENGYLTGMLVICKGKTSLQVWCAEMEVYVLPLYGEFDNHNMLAIIARNEQLLAQLFLNHTTTKEPWMQLAAYFMQRGWSVKEIENTTF